MKVFDHIDFNNFFEKESKSDFYLPRIEQSTFEDKFLENLLIEMAMGTAPGSGTRAAIRLDDDDIVYLYQFLPSDYSRALWWRYGPGLISYARQRHGNIPKQEDDDSSSNFHGADAGGGLYNEDPEDSIEFDEKTLLGSTSTARDEMPDKFGGPDGKPKLDWMRPEDDYAQRKKKHNMGGVKQPTRRRYTNIKFGWNKLYHKLNLDYRFGMHGVDDRHWHKNGQLPNLAGYKPMNWAGLNDDLNRYFKAMGMKHHHPEDYNDQLNAHQQAVSGLGRDPKQTSNDLENIHDINTINKGTHMDGMWVNERPGAMNGTHTLQNTTTTDKDGKVTKNNEYTNHLYSLMSQGLNKTYNRGSDETAVQPFYLGSPKPGANSTYNVYEVFGLHKALKKQEWELERYFPHEFHEMVYQNLKEIGEGRAKRSRKGDPNDEKKELALQISGISGKEVDDENLISALKKQLIAHEYRWQPVAKENIQQGQKWTQDKNGYHYIKVPDEFVKEGLEELQGRRQRLPKWQYLFLARYVNRFNSSKSAGLNNSQNNALTSAYKTIGDKNINDIIGNHKELTFLTNSLNKKQGHQEDADVRRRQIEQKYGIDKIGRHKHSAISPKQKKGESKIELNPKFDRDLKNQKEAVPDKDLNAHASHTDVMVGGVWHDFGGPNSNITEKNTKDGKWHVFPRQSIFVPLLHRGQVLSSEKQVSKGLNVGAFGHSQVAEVEINHFGHEQSDDEFAVSRDVAKRYKSKGVKFRQDPTDPTKYYVNRNDYFWACAEEGDIPSKEFFAGHDEKKGKWGGHTNAMRNTDHHYTHMKKHQTEEDRLYDFNHEGFCGKEGSGWPILKSVKCGVCDALNKIKKQDNSDALVQEMQDRLNTLWSYGMDLLKANVSHPQFFQNSEFETHLKKEWEDMPRDASGKVDVQAARKSGLNFEGTGATGYVWRKMRVANYIGSFSQRGFSENVPFRRDRVGQTEGGTRQATEHDYNKVNKDHTEGRAQDEVVGRTRGQRKHQQSALGEQATAQSSWLRRTQDFLDTKEEAQTEFNIKGIDELTAKEDAVRVGQLALLALWAIESHKVPTASEIAQNSKHPFEKKDDEHNPDAVRPAGISNAVSREKAFSPDFVGTPEYNEAHAEQLKLAMEWARSKVKNEFDERLRKTMAMASSGKEGWYNGPTEAIDDGEFVGKLADKDPIKELMTRAYEYDKKAQFNLTAASFDDLEQTEHTDQYRQLYDFAKQLFPDGLFNVADFGEKFSDDLEQNNFTQSEQGIPAAKVIYDYFLNGVNSESIRGKDREFIKGLLINGKSFEDFLKNSPIQEIQSLGNSFMKNLETKMKTGSNLGKEYIASSVGREHESGRSASMGEFDKKIAKIEKMKGTTANRNKLERVQEDRHDYSKTYTALSAWLHHSKFNVETIRDNLAIMVKTLAEKSEHPEKYWQAFEDAFIDQMIDHLSHAHHHNNNFMQVKESAKYLIRFFNEEGVLENFRSNVKGELAEIINRHDKAEEEAA